MQVSLGVSCNVDIPGVDPLRRRSPPIKYIVACYVANKDVLAYCRGQVDGDVSPLMGLRRHSRTGFSVPFPYDSTQHESILGRQEMESPSESGATSIEINRVASNTQAMHTPEMTVNSVCLTDHDPEGVSLTPSYGSRLFGSLRTSGSFGSLAEGDEVSMSLNSRPRSYSLENICLTDGCDASRTKAQLDSTIPQSGPQCMDLNTHISENEITDEISSREARCSNGVEIFGSPPTALCGIGLHGRYEVCRSPSVREKSDVKGSIILAGLFTGVAVIVGTIFSRPNKE